MLLLGGRARVLIPKLSGSRMFAPNHCSILLVAETSWKERSSGSQMGLCWVLAPFSYLTFIITLCTSETSVVIAHGTSTVIFTVSEMFLLLAECFPSLKLWHLYPS